MEHLELMMLSKSYSVSKVRCEYFAHHGVGSIMSVSGKSLRLCFIPRRVIKHLSASVMKWNESQQRSQATIQACLRN